MSLADEAYCYLTTIGRVSGRPHTIEIWFVLRGGTVYMLSGERDRSDWVKNLLSASDVELRIDDKQLRGHARVVTEPEEDSLNRHLLIEKYQSSYEGDLGNFERTALTIAVDFPPDCNFVESKNV